MIIYDEPRSQVKQGLIRAYITGQEANLEGWSLMQPVLQLKSESVMFTLWLSQLVAECPQVSFFAFWAHPLTY